MKKNSKIILGVVLIFLVLGGLFYFSTKQSVLSLSKINVGNDGQVYWTWFASGTQSGGTYYWDYTPKKYIKKDGSGIIITPKSALSLIVKADPTSCNYQLSKKSKNYGIFGLSTITYYELNNPSMIANVHITDRSTGETKKIDATIANSRAIFYANGGSVVVEAQGVLSAKINCPEYSNVVALRFGNGQYGFYKENKFLNYFSGSNILDTIFASKSNFDSKIGQDKTFSNSFDNFPKLSINENVVRGDVKIGYPTFTISANQKYFKSTSYIPPKNAKPKIESINLLDKIQQGTQSSMVVNLINEGENGDVIIKTSSDIFDVSPSSTTTLLKNSKSVPFNLIAKNIVDCGKINVEVCAGNQFSGNVNCVSDYANSCITEKPTETFCGDGICQPNENSALCPTDCNIINPPTETKTEKTDECGAWVSFPTLNLGITKIEGFTIIPNLFCIIDNFFSPLKWILAILGGLLAGLFGFKMAGDLAGRKKRNRWIPIVAGLILAGSIGALIFIYFWWGISTLIILSILKGVVPGI